MPTSMTATLVPLAALLLALPACLDGGERIGRASTGTSVADSAVATTDRDVTITTPTTPVGSGGVDASTSTPSDATTTQPTPDTTGVADTAPPPDTTTPPMCRPNGVLETGELCDDGNSCALDGCRAETCTPQLTFRISKLALGGFSSFDFNDLDEDGDIYTYGDNVLSALSYHLNPLFAAAIADGELITLITVDDVGDLQGDRAVDVRMHTGVDPTCGGARPDALGEGPSGRVYSDARSFDACTPDDRPEGASAFTTGLYEARFSDAQPQGPLLHAELDGVTIEAGRIGDFALSPVYVDAHIDRYENLAFALTHGRLAGLMPIRALAALNTSAAYGPLCADGLTVFAEYVHYADIDLDGSGGLDAFLTTLDPPIEGAQACVNRTPRIVCCDEGDCDGPGRIEGPDCYLDPRIGDGVSVGFTFEALPVIVTSQVDGATYCAD